MNFYSIYLMLVQSSNQFYILLKRVKSCSVKNYTMIVVKLPLLPTWGGLGMRKDNFLKGVLEGRCAQIVPHGPACVAGARLCSAASGQTWIHPHGRGGVPESVTLRSRKGENGRCTYGLPLQSSAQRDQAVPPLEQRTSQENPWQEPRWKPHRAMGQDFGSGNSVTLGGRLPIATITQKDLTCWVDGPSAGKLTQNRG